MNQRKIKPVTDNLDKQRTYRVQKSRYKRAIENEFFFEALIIDYALLEDRLRSMIYHMGFLKDRTSIKIWKRKSSCLKEIVSIYKEKNESSQIGISSISSKAKIVRCVLKWAMEAEDIPQHDKHLSALKSRCNALNIEGVLSALDELQDWCAYRNEVIHSLMNKNLESLSNELEERVKEGMRLGEYFDKQEKQLKKRNIIRRSAKLQMN